VPRDRRAVVSGSNFPLLFHLGAHKVSIRLVQTESGVVLPVKAQPGARKNGFTGEHDGMLKVSVTQAPEKGKANKVLVRVIAQELKLRNSQIELISGDTSSIKMFLITGVEIESYSIDFMPIWTIDLTSVTTCQSIRRVRDSDVRLISSLNRTQSSGDPLCRRAALRPESTGC
jgi:uncharacterized protein